jgi:hypothetical protein
MTFRLTRHLVGATLLSAALALSHAGSAEVTLSADEMRAAARKSLQAKDPVRARLLADALLQRDPADITALLVRSRALRDMGAYGEAHEAAREAWSQSDTAADRYASALMAAQALSSDSKRTRAQFWLRRAVQHAPSPALEAKATRDFLYVRQRNPWKTQLSFVLAPNSNINNGSAEETSYLHYRLTEVLYGRPVAYSLTGSAQALSGLELGAALRSRYRFRETATTAQDLKFGLSYRSYILSDSAEAQAPGVSGGDFAFGTLSLGYGYRQRNLAGRGELVADLEAGQTFYGGARYASTLRGSLGQALRRAGGRQYRFGIDAQHLVGQATPDLDSLGLRASLSERLAGGGLAYLGLSTEFTQSPEPTAEYAEVELRGGYVLGRPVLGAALELGLGVALRDYEVSLHAPDGRQDRKLFADLTATFTEVDYYGFNPSLTLRASRTDSNIGLYDVNRLGLSLGIKSAF